MTPQKIYIIDQYINNKEERDSAMLLTKISKHEQAKKLNKGTYDTLDKD